MTGSLAIMLETIEYWRGVLSTAFGDADIDAAPI